MIKQCAVLLDVTLSGKQNYCKEIYYEVVKRNVTVGMATVYRMVSILEEIDALSRYYQYSLSDRPCLEGRARDWPDQIQNIDSE